MISRAFWSPRGRIEGNENAQIPTYRLSVNNSIFVERPFVPTYQESININSKLKSLKKDYNDFEQEIESLNEAFKAVPKRPASRKKRDILNNIEKSRNISILPEISNTNPLNNWNNNRKMDGFEERFASEENIPREEVKNQFSKKRMSWVKDEQLSFPKNNEINHAFDDRVSSKPVENLDSYTFGQQAQKNRQINSQQISVAQKIQNIREEYISNKSQLAPQQSFTQRPPEEFPEKTFGKLPERFPERAFERNTERVVEKLPERVVDRIPEKQFERQPQTSQQKPRSDYHSAVQRRKEAKAEVNSRREKLARAIRMW